MNGDLKESCIELMELFMAINRNHDTRIKKALEEAIRVYFSCLFENEAGVLSPTPGMIKCLNKFDIHVLGTPVFIKDTSVRREEYKPISTIYSVRYEDGVNEDITIVINPDGTVV